MSTFIMTPTYLSDVEDILKDPVTGQWVIPQLIFNTISTFTNPLNTTIDPLNDDPSYHRKVTEYFHTKLPEKWLYSAPAYRSLLKYFKISKHDSKVTVELLTDPDKAKESDINIENEKYIFKFIEKYFATEKFENNTSSTL